MYRPASTPIDRNHKLREAKEYVVVDREMYQYLVRRLIYLSHTRLDIAYAVRMISQFMHGLKENHLQTVNRVLHYLKGSPGKSILFNQSSGLILEAYTNTNYVGFVANRSSPIGYCTFLGRNLVSWKGKK